MAQPWTLAPCLVQLREEINAKWPGRDRTSDGAKGDAAHAARKSDHNPNAAGVVCAIDVDEDGIDCPWLVEHVRQLGALGDPRVGYVIYEGRIAGPKSRGWEWREYDGVNPHEHHAHVSANQAATGYTRTGSWGVSTAVLQPSGGHVTMTQPVKSTCPGITRPGDGLRPKAPSEVTKAYQRLLVAAGYLPNVPGSVDGRHGDATSAAIRKLQVDRGLDRDTGAGGPQVWNALGGNR